MDQPMVKAAEENQVVQGRLSAIGPVLHMMTVGKAEPATGEATAPVACLQGPTQGGRDRPGPASRPLDRTVQAMVDRHQASVTGETSRRFS